MCSAAVLLLHSCGHSSSPLTSRETNRYQHLHNISVMDSTGSFIVLLQQSLSTVRTDFCRFLFLHCTVPAKQCSYKIQDFYAHAPKNRNMNIDITCLWSLAVFDLMLGTCLQLQDTLLQREEELARLQEENNKLREFLSSSFVRTLEEKAKVSSPSQPVTHPHCFLNTKVFHSGHRSDDHGYFFKL